MGFYEEFAERYDQLSWDEDRYVWEEQLLRNVLEEYSVDVETALDCACGTGHHVLMLDDMGIDAKGSDASPSMIEKAEENAGERDLDLRVAKFQELSSEFDQKFDLLLCLGNSLPHVGHDELVEALQEMYKVLDEGGLLLIEMRNFDHLLEERKRFFPMKISEEEVFFYILDYEENEVVFNVVYLEPRKGEWEVHSTTYSALRKEQLEEAMEEVGFTSVDFYGNYNLNPLDLSKDDRYVVVGRK